MEIARRDEVGHVGVAAPRVFDPTPSILTICVNYNNYEETACFIEKLLGQKGNFNQIAIVVDNSENPLADGPLQEMLNKHSKIRLYTPNKNLGYYGGATFGLCEYSKFSSLPDWIIVCNTDIDLINHDFLSSFFNLYAGTHHAIIAPAIYSTLSKVDQNPFMLRRPSTVKMHFYKWIYRYYPTYVIYESLAFIKKKLRLSIRTYPVVTNCGGGDKTFQAVPRPIYAPHGSFVVFHRSYFEAGGSLNYSVFLFDEEVFIAESARRLGLIVTYDPRLFVLHREHASTGVLENRKKYTYLREATAYCADNYFCDIK